MSKDISFFNLSIHKILTKEQSALDKPRIRLLYYGFWIVGVAVAGLFISVYFQRQTLLTISAGILFVSFIGLFKYLTYRPNWKQISHAVLIIGSIININTIFIALQKVDIITVQVLVLIVLFSYYMLGQGWGLFYSLLNLIPVMVFLLIYYYDGYYIAMRPETIDESTTIIGVFTNFLLIVYIHSHFYGAFQRNIEELKATGEKQQQLNMELALAMQKAEQSSRIKTDFLATMSHEIRTPLNAIIGMSNVMLMNNPRTDQKENLDVLKLSANSLMAIVNDVLDFNKIESGQLVFENAKFNLYELVQNICGPERLKAEEKGLIFSLKVDPLLNNKLLAGDPVRLGQVLFNLVSNAIKFTRAGTIWVRATSYEHNEMVTVNFAIKDTGIGMDQNHLQNIFEPFTQESITATRRYGGTGMGLAIVKRLLELQGVHMNVASKLGKGSEFSFSMDFPVAEIVQPAAMLQDADGLGSLKMLVVEDNPVNVLLMQKLLSKWRITPLIAGNGVEAVQMAQSDDFDIILMDLQMPVMNGFDAAVEIRRLPDEKKANTPIIALSAAAMTDINEQILEAGMNDYVSKPFKPKDLLDKIQTLVTV